MKNSGKQKLTLLAAVLLLMVAVKTQTRTQTLVKGVSIAAVFGSTKAAYIGLVALACIVILVLVFVAAK